MEIAGGRAHLIRDNRARATGSDDDSDDDLNTVIIHDERVRTDFAICLSLSISQWFDSALFWLWLFRLVQIQDSDSMDLDESGDDNDDDNDSKIEELPSSSISTQSTVRSLLTVLASMCLYSLYPRTLQIGPFLNLCCLDCLR